MLHIIIGPPCAGKSTYVQEHAQKGDLRVDFDKLATALGSDTPHRAEGHIKAAAFEARQAAIDYAVTENCEAYIIHTSPSEKQLEEYIGAGAELVYMDTDLETCLARAEQDGRPEGTAEVIREYFKEGKMQFKKAADLKEDGGIVKGYAATFVREPDSYGDVIAKGAFTESLERWSALEQEGKSIPLLYGHNMDDPFHNIGHIVFAKEDDYGLYIEAAFDAENETAQYARKLVQEGRLYQFSFAYSVLDSEQVELEDGSKANELRKLDLYEVSLVQIPANQTAVVTEVKAIEDVAESLKSGKRNSAKDSKELQRIGALAEEIKEAVSGLLAVSEDTADGKSEGASEDEAEFVSAYKQALIDYYKE